MGFQFNKNIDAVRTTHSAGYILAFSLVTFIMVLTLAAGSAWSFDTFDTKATRVGDSVRSQAPPSSVADQCLPLLESIRHLNTPSATARTQRSAGHATGLALVFGVRFALSPPEKTGYGVNSWQFENGDRDRFALAIADYRHCRKQQALSALQSLR